MNKHYYFNDFERKMTRKIERIIEAVLSDRAAALDLLDAILKDDELTAADVQLCGQLRVTCMMMFRDLNTLRRYQEISQEIFTETGAEKFNALIDGLGKSCEEILEFEALVAGAFSASLRYESPYAAEEERLDKFMDDKEPSKDAVDTGSMSDDEMREQLRSLLHVKTHRCEGFHMRRGECIGSCRDNLDAGRVVLNRSAQRKGRQPREAETVRVKLICGADVPARLEQMLKQRIERAIHESAQEFRMGRTHDASGGWS